MIQVSSLSDNQLREIRDAAGRILAVREVAGHVSQTIREDAEQRLTKAIQASIRIPAIR